MSHRIYTGAFEALERKWLEEVSLLKQADPLIPVTILVGSNILATYLKIRIAEQGKVAANLRFCTFLDLVGRLRTVPDRIAQKPRLPNLGASVILEHVLSRHVPEVFQAVAGFAGFRDALLDTFRDLRDAGISAPALSAGVARCIEGTPDRGPHLSGLAGIYRLFREKVACFQGIDDDFRTAISNSPLAAGILGSRVLLVYGLYDVTGQQSDFLTALGRSMDLIYFIPYIDSTISPFAAGFLGKCEGELGVGAERLSCNPRTDALGALGHVDFGFLPPSEAGTNASPESVDRTVSLVSAPGESRVAVEVVREILRAARDGILGDFSEAAVVLRQPDADVPVLQEAFRLRNIPCYVHGGTTFVRRPFAKAVLAIAGLETSSFSREKIFTAMEWISASLPGESSERWQVDDWRTLTAVPRFLAGVSAWDDGIAGLVQSAAVELEGAKGHAARIPREVGEEDRRQVLSLPAARRRMHSAEGLRAAWTDLRTAAAEWPDSSSWELWARFLVERLEPLLGESEDWHTFSAVVDEIAALESVAETAGIAEEVSLARLTIALEETFSSLSCPTGRFMRSGVNLLSPSAARGLRFSLVIVPGLEEGKFPARLRQDPLLFDSERSLVGGKMRLPLKLKRADEERLLFDMAARAAQNRLVLIFSRLDEASDRERIPSEFFLRVAAAVRGNPVGLRDLAAGSVPGFRSVSLDNPAPPDGEFPVDRGEVRLRFVARDPATARIKLKLLAEEEAELIRGTLQYDEARWLPRLTAYDGRLSDPGLVKYARELIGPGAGPVSASRLESYAKCPYLFYLQRVMGLEALEEPRVQLSLDPLVRGDTIHSILEKFLREFPGELFASSAIEELEVKLLSMAGPALDEIRPPGMQDLLWEIEHRALEQLLANWLRFEKTRVAQGLLPASFERPFGTFGPGKTDPGLPIQAGSHRFVFRGRIDRIDLSTNGRSARVIDYKTGRLPETMGRRTRPLLMAGEKMQVALYPLVLPLLDGFSDLDAIEGEFLHLQPRDGEIVPCAFDPMELREAARRLPEILAIIGDGLEGGVFFARSAGAVRPKGHCAWCDFLNVCGKDRIRREERKSGDPAVAHFGRMAQIDPPSEGEQ